MDCWAPVGRSWCSSSCGDLGAFLGGAWLSGCVWVDGGFHRVHLHFEKKHCDARGDLRVCESGGGAFSWVASHRGVHQSAHGDRRRVIDSAVILSAVLIMITAPQTAAMRRKARPLNPRKPDPARI